MRRTWPGLIASAACVLVAGTAWAHGAKPLKSCPADSVVSGADPADDVCHVDLTASSVATPFTVKPFSLKQRAEQRLSYIG